MRRVALAASAMIAAALLPGGSAAAPPTNARIFDRTWSLIDRRFWDRGRIARGWAAARDLYRPQALAAPDTHALYLTLARMLDTLGDSHVYVVDPLRMRLEKARARGHGELGFGFAAETERDGRQTVVGVDRDSPADRAGVRIGWVFTRADGGPVDVDYQPAAGRSTPLEFLDEHGATRRLTLTAGAALPHVAREAELLPGDVALLRLDDFDPGADAWLRRALARRPAAVILDLRGNDGGEAGVVARVAGLLFPHDRPMLVEIGTHETTRFTMGAGARSYGGPLAVLIGPDSASGAEVIAALVQDAGRGATLGARSAGALTSAAEYFLPDGGLLSLAESDVRTPAGRRIEGNGVLPDHRVVATLAERRAGSDPAVTCARAILLEMSPPARCGFSAAGAAPKEAR